MRASEKQELKQKIKRLGIFLLIVFLPAMVVAVLLAYVAKVPQWLNMLVLVIMLFVLFFIYSLLMQKLDKHKNERLKKKKDPFSEN